MYCTTCGSHKTHGLHASSSRQLALMVWQRAIRTVEKHNLRAAKWKACLLYARLLWLWLWRVTVLFWDNEWSGPGQKKNLFPERGHCRQDNHISIEGDRNTTQPNVHSILVACTCALHIVQCSTHIPAMNRQCKLMSEVWQKCYVSHIFTVSLKK